MAIEKLLLVDGVSYLSIEVDDPSDLLLASTVEAVLVSETSLDWGADRQRMDYLRKTRLHYNSEKTPLDYTVDK